ncbi:hypothetical protein [Dyadobacter alkalitolerans]|uniref:hypothetical protein n=1 Tax=Dyadobacter alkalitolerans TaxID=492736 RepID=UPI000419EF30|nr:hypothetical protein [Dyadobacter alkalitolerans]
MITTAQEKEIIEQVIQMRTANKRKWAYLLYDIIEEKLSRNISYENIAKWLSDEGLSINENALKQLIWSYKKKIKKLEHGKENQNLIREITVKKSSSFNEEKKVNIDQNLDENLDDLNQRLQRGSEQLKKKNTGFDAFDDL